MNTTTQQRVLAVLEQMKRMAEADHDNAEAFAEVLDTALNELRAQDFFGTEAQNDPRGDGRNGGWSMARVEGIDG